MKKILFKSFGVICLTALMLGIGVYANHPPGEVRAQGPNPNAVQFSVIAVADTNTEVIWDTAINREVSLYNSGASTAYVNFTTTAATTADMPLYADMTINLSPFSSKEINLICGSGESTTVTLYAPKYTAP